MNTYPKVIFVMGVSGSGKTSIGQLLARNIGYVFLDADDYHPSSNVNKMSQGIPLTDEDRSPWLDQIHQVAMEHQEKGCVIACSALKEIYRTRLSTSFQKNLVWVYLKGDYDLIFDRMQKRKGHFMDAKMLQSQYETLEEPSNAIEINIIDTPEIIVNKIKNQLS